MLKFVTDNLNSYIYEAKTTIGRAFEDRMFMVFLLFVVIIFSFLSYYLFNKFIKPKLDKEHVLNKEIKNNKNNEKDAIIILFKTEWCPYCKQAMPEWEKFKNHVENINSSEINDYQIILSIIDCDEKPKIAEKYDIKGYPTIKLIYKGEVYDYDAKPNKENLIKFLESSIE